LAENLLVAIWGLLFMASAIAVIRMRRKLGGFTNYLNLVSILLVAFPVITIVVHRRSLRGRRPPEIRVAPVHLEKSGTYPDIYYIILDGYARADILKEFYQYDNTEFLNHLAQKGFFVADKARSNYAQTNLSLASSLNLTYLDDLAEQMGPESNNRAPLRQMFMNSKVAGFLKEHDYLMVGFSSGISLTEWKNADIFITPQSSLSEFENLLLNTTPIPLLLNKLPEKTQYDLHRERLLYVFKHLADMADLDAPVFVIAHIMTPHPPFVFGENGEKIEPDTKFSFHDGSQIMPRYEYVENYKNQLIFVNKKIKAAIDEIISKSSAPPIIIFQADHGPGSMLDWSDLDKTNFRERMSIFNVYYLPDSGDKELYDGITPVNTFRIIFNHYFGTDLDILEDKCYFSTWRHPYKFIDVTDETNTD